VIGTLQVVSNNFTETERDVAVWAPIEEGVGFACPISKEDERDAENANLSHLLF